jgi:hypothetical protein
MATKLSLLDDSSLDLCPSDVCIKGSENSSEEAANILLTLKSGNDNQ